jgi:hypothetical protein
MSRESGRKDTGRRKSVENLRTELALGGGECQLHRLADEGSVFFRSLFRKTKMATRGVTLKLRAASCAPSHRTQGWTAIRLGGAKVAYRCEAVEFFPSLGKRSDIADLPS